MCVCVCVCTPTSTYHHPRRGSSDHCGVLRSGSRFMHIGNKSRETRIGAGRMRKKWRIPTLPLMIVKHVATFQDLYYCFKERDSDHRMVLFEFV